MAKPTRQTKLSSTKTSKDVISICARFLEDIDTPVALGIYIRLKNRMYRELSEVKISPLDYLNASTFQLDYQAIELLSKNNFLDSGIDKSAVAVAKFLQAEEQCKTQNSIHLDKKSLSMTERARLLSKVSRKITSILGEIPNLRNLHCGFGPGASSACTGRDVTLGDKLAAPIEISRNAIGLFEDVIKSYPHVLASTLGVDFDGPYTALGVYTLRDYNTLVTVPKNSKTDRAICIEPHFNIFLQKGLGTEIRTRLRHHGIDLDKQSDRNAFLARQGSIDNSIATVDLSSASDTISYMLVMDLLPIQWFDLLDKCRSPMTLVNGELHINEKFSSMGNGYTFELESLIFYAISLVACEEAGVSNSTVSVFGDDITIDTGAVDFLLNILTLFGFKVNAKKTFTSGPFRESCGKDYFNGILVRPYYLKDLPEYETDFINIANGIRKFSYRFAHNGCCDRKFYRGWSKAVSFIPTEWRTYGPQELGDEVLWAPMSEVRVMFNKNRTPLAISLHRIPIKKRLLSFPGMVQRAVVLQATYCHEGDTYVACIDPLRDAVSGTMVSDLPLRGKSSMVTRKRVPVPYWDRYDGAWIG